MNPTVYIVDDDAAVRDSLTQLLEVAGMQVQSFASGEAFLGALPSECTGCVLLDIAMPGMSGIEVQQAMAARRANLPIVFLSGHGDIPTAVHTLQAGAVDFLEKPVDGKKLIARLERALAISEQLNQQRSEVLDILTRYDRMSRREREVMQLVASGMTSKEIGAQLGISPRTVDVHRANIGRKMKAGSLAELVNMASVCAKR